MVLSKSIAATKAFLFMYKIIITMMTIMNIYSLVFSDLFLQILKTFPHSLFIHRHCRTNSSGFTRSPFHSNRYLESVYSCSRRVNELLEMSINSKTLISTFSSIYHITRSALFKRFYYCNSYVR